MEATERKIPPLNQQVFEGVLRRNALSPEQISQLEELIEFEERLKSTYFAATRYPKLQEALEEDQRRYQQMLEKIKDDSVLQKAKRDYDKEISEASQESEP